MSTGWINALPTEPGQYWFKATGEEKAYVWDVSGDADGLTVPCPGVEEALTLREFLGTRGTDVGWWAPAVPPPFAPQLAGM